MFEQLNKLLFTKIRKKLEKQIEEENQESVLDVLNSKHLGEDIK